jgi:hypothetical protein
VKKKKEGENVGRRWLGRGRVVGRIRERMAWWRWCAVTEAGGLTLFS